MAQSKESIFTELETNCTCGASPEQYDIYYKGMQAGYLRLRWGHFTAEYPDVGGSLVYEYQFEDGWKGEFEETERVFYLYQALLAIASAVLEYPELMESADV